MRRRQQSAFTLLEIMLVVMIIGLLLGTAVYKQRGNLEVSKRDAEQSSLQSIRTQLKLYESMNGFPPTTEQGLQALVAQPQGEPQPFTSIPAGKTRTVSTCIRPAPIALPIPRMTIGETSRRGFA